MYDRLRERLGDVAFTTATPFDPETGAVRYDDLRANVRAVEDAGARLFVPCGNTGEYYALSREERADVVAAHVDALSDDAVVVGGVGGSTKTAVDLVGAYEAAGADAVMVMHPHHALSHERGLVRYYERIAASTDLGVVVYKRGHDVSRRVLSDVCPLDNVVGVKYAVNDVKAFSRAVEDVPGDVTWINGLAERYAPSFAVEGAAGYTTGVGNFAPKATLELFDAVRERNWERAREVRSLVRPYEDLREEPGVENDLAAANNVPAVKYGMDLAGLHGGAVREPLVDLAERDRERAEEHFARIDAAGLTL